MRSKDKIIHWTIASTHSRPAGIFRENENSTLFMFCNPTVRWCNSTKFTTISIQLRWPTGSENTDQGQRTLQKWDWETENQPTNSLFAIVFGTNTNQGRMVRTSTFENHYFPSSLQKMSGKCCSTSGNVAWVFLITIWRSMYCAIYIIMQYKRLWRVLWFLKRCATLEVSFCFFGGDIWCYMVGIARCPRNSSLHCLPLQFARLHPVVFYLLANGLPPYPTRVLGRASCN